MNAGEKLGGTALTSAAYGGHVGIVKLLLAQGAEVNPASEMGETALNLAEKAGHSEVVELLRRAGAREDLGR